LNSFDRKYPGLDQWLFPLIVGLSLLPMGASSLGDDEIPPPPVVAPTAEPAPSPMPSFPGVEERVTFANQDAGVTLAGVLVLPPGKGPFPAALYLCGGGPGMAAYFIPFAEALAQKGIAVLVYDKRGCGQSTGDFKGSHYPEFQQDAMCGFEFLKKQSRINSNKVGFIGHSEGGMITEMIAAEHSDVAFAVLMAAPGMRGDRLRALQGVQESKAYGVDAKVLKNVQEIFAELLPLLETEEDPRVSRPKIHEILTKGYADLDEKEKAQLREVLEMDNPAIEEKAPAPWYRQFLLWDPIPYLKKIQCPVLALNGDKDIAVVYPQNLTAIGEALKEGGNRDYTLKMFPRVNHLFLHCVTGAPTEKPQDFDPEVEQVIGDWLVKHTK
jgi:pimeloyl-ACP methyl ester carboxylesterase